MGDDIERQLVACGLAPGEVIAAIGGNSSEIWTLLRATGELGLVLAILNDSWSPSLLNHFLERLGPRFIAGYGPRRNRGPFRTDGSPREAGNVSLVASGLRDGVASDLCDSVDGAVIFCTSGSTGEPKFVVSSPQNRKFSARTIGRYLGLVPGQCIVNALSPSFDYGLYQGLLASEFDLGMTLIRSPQMTGDILAALRKKKRIVLPITPALAARLVRALAPGENFRDVEIVTLTGGATSAGLRQRLKEVFPDAKIFAMYGLTECKRVAFLPPEEFLDFPMSCGREMPGVFGALLDPAGLPVPHGGVGELVVRGANVCLGYWGDAEATARRFRRDANGKVTLHTGDSFRRDAEGRLEFVSRNDELVKLRDERVSLAAIEGELRRSRLVLDLALEIVTDNLGIPLLRVRVIAHTLRVTDAELFKSFREVVSRAGHLPHEVIITHQIALNSHGKHAKAPPAARSDEQLIPAA